MRGDDGQCRFNSVPVVTVEKQLLCRTAGLYITTPILLPLYINSVKLLKKKGKGENSRGLVHVNQSTCLIIGASHSWQ